VISPFILFTHSIDKNISETIFMTFAYSNRRGLLLCAAVFLLHEDVWSVGDVV